MRIFASWSGTPSRLVALLFRDWIPNVLQDVDVYVSSQDIAKGERWLMSVSGNLEENDFGLSIITPDNLDAPWILFEAGALAKSLKSRLVPVLCGIETINIANHPLSQFQYVLAPLESEIFRMMESINAGCAKPLSDERLRSTFQKWFPDFEAQFRAIDLGDTVSELALPTNTQIAIALSDVLRELRDLRQATRPLAAKTQSAGEYFDKYIETSPALDRKFNELWTKNLPLDLSGLALSNSNKRIDTPSDDESGEV